MTQSKPAAGSTEGLAAPALRLCFGGPRTVPAGQTLRLRTNRAEIRGKKWRSASGWAGPAAAPAPRCWRVGKSTANTLQLRLSVWNHR